LGCTGERGRDIFVAELEEAGCPTREAANFLKLIAIALSRQMTGAYDAELIAHTWGTASHETYY